jgi:hypothetical protein
MLDGQIQAIFKYIGNGLSKGTLICHFWSNLMCFYHEFWSSTLAFNTLTIGTKTFKNVWNSSVTLLGKEDILIDLKIV